MICRSARRSACITGNSGVVLTGTRDLPNWVYSVDISATRTHLCNRHIVPCSHDYLSGG
jgi:hypothetical protein